MKSIIKSINPFKDGVDNSKGSFIIQKLLAFLIVYMVSAFVMEGIIIAGYSIAGYDVLNGDMPAGDIIRRIRFYGMGGFIVITYLFVRLFEKRGLKSMGVKFDLAGLAYTFVGLIGGALLVALSIGVLAVTGLVEFDKVGDISLKNAVLWFVAYFVQSTTEEFMCRAFMQTSLNRRVGVGVTILLSGVVFLLPHLDGLSDMSFTTKVIGIANIMLVSALFSVALLKTKYLGLSCGIHAGWNYCLGIVFGLTVTGGDAKDAIINMKTKSGYDIITGGKYGIEAGIIIIPVLALAIYVIVRLKKKERVANGVQQETI